MRNDNGERDARIDLAACYRLVARMGMDDVIYNHISARIPGRENEFLINPYGMLFDEITASSLVRIDSTGRKLDETPYEVNVAAFVIHSAIHRGRADAACVLHAHPDAATAVSRRTKSAGRTLSRRTGGAPPWSVMSISTHDAGAACPTRRRKAVAASG